MTQRQQMRVNSVSVLREDTEKGKKQGRSANVCVCLYVFLGHITH